MAITSVLMCRPTYFDIEYSINPWMDVNNRVNKEKAAAQWQHVYDLIKDLGIAIHLIDPVPGLPDMTFIGDIGMVFNKRFLASNYRFEQRQGERAPGMEWMRRFGYEVLELPSEVIFEGLGDIVYHGNDILFGYGPRSSPEAITQVRRVYPELNLLGELHLKDESLYHLGLAIAFLGDGTLLYYPQAFTDESVRFLESRFERRIAVGEEDAKRYFVCNNIPIGNKVLVDNCTDQLQSELTDRGLEVIKTDMSEFKKSGGSVRCLILAL